MAQNHNRLLKTENIQGFIRYTLTSNNDIDRPPIRYVYNRKGKRNILSPGS